MRAPTSALDAARIDVDRRAQLADEHGDYAEYQLLRSLAGVADMVCRIGDNTHSAHYRAEKAGPLVYDALEVRCEALGAYAGRASASDTIHEATELLRVVERAMGSALWSIARDERPWESQAAELRARVHSLVRWVDMFTATAIPDPVE